MGKGLRCSCCHKTISSTKNSYHIDIHEQADKFGGNTLQGCANMLYQNTITCCADCMYEIKEFILSLDSRNYEQWVRNMIRDGFIDGKTLAPIKCFECGSRNIYESNHDIGGYNIPEHCLTEFDMRCADCGALVAHWAYGGWDY